MMGIEISIAQENNIVIKLTFAEQKNQTDDHTQRVVVELQASAVPSEAAAIFSHPNADKSHRQNPQGLDGANADNEYQRRAVHFRSMPKSKSRSLK